MANTFLSSFPVYSGQHPDLYPEYIKSCLAYLATYNGVLVGEGTGFRAVGIEGLLGGGSVSFLCSSCDERLVGGTKACLSRVSGVDSSLRDSVCGDLCKRVAEGPGAGGPIDGFSGHTGGGSVNITDSSDDVGVAAGSECAPVDAGIEEQSVASADLSGPTLVRGKNWERNREWRRQKKEKKQKKKQGYVPRGNGGAFGSDDWNADRIATAEARKTLNNKWVVENELAAERARRKLEILKASSLDQEVKRYRTRVCLQTESNMVDIERVHSKLILGGNVTEDQNDCVRTIVSGATGELSSGTISPNSSVSEAEVRKLQKDFEDVKKGFEDIQKEKAELQVAYDKLEEVVKARLGIDASDLVLRDKREWTVDENGELPEETEEKIGNLYGDDYVVCNRVNFTYEEGTGKILKRTREVFPVSTYY